MACGNQSCGVAKLCGEHAYRLGWKARPLAREDLDSNCLSVSYHSSRRSCVRLGQTFVSMLGEDGILGVIAPRRAGGSHSAVSVERR